MCRDLIAIYDYNLAAKKTSADMPDLKQELNT